MGGAGDERLVDRRRRRTAAVDQVPELVGVAGRRLREMVHDLRGRPLVRVNCAALPASLIAFCRSGETALVSIMAAPSLRR